MAILDERLAERLNGVHVPDLRLTDATGREVHLARLIAGPAVLYLYPGGDDVPIAPPPASPRSRRRKRAAPEPERPRAPSSCAVQRRGFRDLALDFAAMRVKIFGVSCEPHELQRQLTLQEQLPFTLLSDPDLTLADTLRLPTIEDRGARRYRRVTLMIDEHGRIDTALYPVSPKRGPRQTLAWVQRAWAL